jgi:hypothetical protein
MPTPFNGTLNLNEIYSNEIFGALYNMIISQQVFADNFSGLGEDLAELCKVDGTLYGDTKVYYSADILKTYDWLNDAEAANLLELHRPKAPETQKITIDQFRQLRLTVDNYLSKRAWGSEGAFSSFMSVMTGMLAITKRIYNAKLINAFIGTTETNIGKQAKTITIANGDNYGLKVAESLADLLVALKDPNRDYNDYGHMRSYSEKDFVIIWNADLYNQIKYVDLPTVFHNQGLTDKFTKKMLPGYYFGKPVGTTGTSTTNAANTSVRSLIETDYQVTGADADERAEQIDGTWYVHVLPGDLLPGGVTFNQAEAYNEDNTIVYKVMHRKSVPFMSAFSVATNFFNPRSLTENKYLTFGYNTLDYLANYPFITARQDIQE